MRILVLGGGFGGVHAAIHLERQFKADPGVEITLISRDNFFLFTPMLHEVAASDLDITHIVSPLRTLLRRTVVYIGEVEAVDVERHEVTVAHGFERHRHVLPYDHVVFALGSITNFHGLPGLERHALTMKTLGDAIHLRNRVIATLEEADSECAALGSGLLTFVIAGGGFAGVETAAGVNDFVRDALRFYPRIRADRVRMVLVHSGPVILPELGKTHPPTAQHALREARTVAHNIAAVIRGRQPRAFEFRTIGQLAAIGRRTGVARVFGVNFSGFVAWWLWRTIYLGKLPRLEKKIRVAIDWTLDLIFSKDFVQFLTVRAPAMSMPEPDAPTSVQSMPGTPALLEVSR